MGVRQPGVQGEHRHLYREGQGEGREQPPLRGDAEIQVEHAQVGETQLAGLVPVDEGQGNDPRQHQGGAEGGVEEELDRRVDTVLAPPYADDEGHRHQDHLEEHEEQEQVER